MRKVRIPQRTSYPKYPQAPVALEETYSAEDKMFGSDLVPCSGMEDLAALCLGDEGERLRAVGAERGDSGEQSAGIGVLRVAYEVSGRRKLDDAAAEHDRNAIGDPRDDSEIM